MGPCKLSKDSIIGPGKGNLDLQIRSMVWLLCTRLGSCWLEIDYLQSIHLLRPTNGSCLSGFHVAVNCICPNPFINPFGSKNTNLNPPIHYRYCVAQPNSNGEILLVAHKLRQKLIILIKYSIIILVQTQNPGLLKKLRLSLSLNIKHKILFFF